MIIIILTIVNKLMNMEIIIVMNASLVKANGPQGYLIGGIIAVFVLGYLVYTLIRPEKF